LENSGGILVPTVPCEIAQFVPDVIHVLRRDSFTRTTGGKDGDRRALIRVSAWLEKAILLSFDCVPWVRRSLRCRCGVVFRFAATGSATLRTVSQGRLQDRRDGPKKGFESPLLSRGRPNEISRHHPFYLYSCHVSAQSAVRRRSSGYIRCGMKRGRAIQLSSPGDQPMLASSDSQFNSVPSR